MRRPHRRGSRLRVLLFRRDQRDAAGGRTDRTRGSAVPVRSRAGPRPRPRRRPGAGHLRAGHREAPAVPRRREPAVVAAADAAQPRHRPGPALATRDRGRGRRGALPCGYRTVVVLHDIEQWRVREIAELQEISLPAAKQRLRRGRMMLVSALASGAERRERLQGVPMRCWDARRHVSEYLDGALDADTAATVEAHLATCPTCPPLYAALVGAHERLADLADPDTVIPPDLEERLRSVVDDRPGT